MASVPFEKTYASTEGSEEIALSAGSTSGKVPNESYAFINLLISGSERATEFSAKACLSDA